MIKVIHLLSLNYNYSKYDERDVITGLITSNNTHTALLTYVPTFLTKDISPDFSLMYFYNSVPGFKLTLITIQQRIKYAGIKKENEPAGTVAIQLFKN